MRESSPATAHQPWLSNPRIVELTKQLAAGSAVVFASYLALRLGHLEAETGPEDSV